MTRKWSVKDPCDWEVQHASHFAAERLPLRKLSKAALMTVIYAQVNVILFNSCFKHMYTNGF